MHLLQILLFCSILREGALSLSIRILMMDEERMGPDYWLGFVQCFHTKDLMA